MHAPAIYDPRDLNSSEPPALSDLGYRLLAEGDSWFTIGSLNPAKNSNLLFELAFSQRAAVVNCAYPGDELRKMAAMSVDELFMRQLEGRTARFWDGILLSAGGNDLIEALAWRGAGVPASQRLLRTADEWGDAALGPARYISDVGWEVFADYLRANLAQLLRWRDAGPSKHVPVFMHGYAVPTPRPAGAGFGMGPWLLPSLQAFAIPPADYIALAGHLIERMGAVFAGCAADTARYPHLHFFDSTRLPVVPARLDTTGSDGDWVNEIHLSWQGYEKIARPWSAEIEAVIRRWRGQG